MVTPNIGELMVILGAFHIKEIPLEPNEREQIFHLRQIIRRKVRELIIDGENYTNVASMILIDKLQL